jgi:signal transduction histidine kinase
MANLPSVRQKRLKPTVATRRAAQKALTRAFVSFSHVASSLEKSYEKLQSEVGRLRAELHRANFELAESLEENSRVRRYLSRTLEGLPCGVVALDAQNSIRVINPEARRLLQLATDWAPNSGAALPNAVREFLAKATSAEASELSKFTSHAPDGEIPIAVAHTRLSEIGDSGEETVLILRDITEETRMAAERESARRVHALAELSTLLAHEIRNPLGSLELFAGLIADATSNLPDARHWVDHLQAGLRGLSATVNNVLNFHSQPSPSLVSVNLERLLRETAEFLRPVARQRGLQLSVVNRAGEIRVSADPHRLQQVFFNLSLNAFRAMSKGGALCIPMDWAAHEEGRTAQIDFEDHGAGILPENLPKIFEPGFSTNPGSPGLGLSVCKTVIEQHGGSISVLSVPKRGTTFSLFLPVKGVSNESSSRR